MQPGTTGGEKLPRSDRLLRTMHKVVSHDLPNQMVALRSLLQLLQIEESERLSADGREYVRRLQNATQRAGEMVRFLKELDRLSTFACRSEAIPLDQLARELQGELQRLLPTRQFTFEWQWSAPSIVGDPRVFPRAIGELCGGLLSGALGPCRLQARSQARGDGIELVFRVEEFAGARTGAPAGPLVLRCFEAGDPLEVALARQWLALCDAELHTSPAGHDASFSIVPGRR